MKHVKPSKLGIINLMIALFALFISGISVYFQFIYEEEILKLSVLDVRFDVNEDLVVDMALINGGTRPFLISSYYLAVTPKEDAFGRQLLGSSDYLFSDSQKALILQPEEVTIVSETISLSASEKNRLLDMYCLPTKLHLTFNLVDSSGKAFISSKNIAKFEHSGKGIRVFVARKVRSLLNKEDEVDPYYGETLLTRFYQLSNQGLLWQDSCHL